MLKGNEAITNEVVGQSHVESVALTTFDNGDKRDRASDFSK